MIRSLVAPTLVVALLLGVPASSRAEKSAFTIQDFYRLKLVEDPRISPDGRTIAYVVRTSDLPRATRTARIWLMDADGSNRRALTSGEKLDTDPRWSADGASIAFVSTRSGSAQLWIIPVGGGEPTQLTKLSTEVADPVWAARGGLIAFDSSVYPECPTDSCNKEIDTRREKGSLQAHVADHLLYRHWTEWKDGKRSHIFVVDTVTGKVRDLTPGDYDSPVFQASGPLEFDLSPDGKELCFSSKREPNEERSTNSDLWIVPTAGGKARSITAKNAGYDGTPRYSPDGRWIAFRTQATPGYESDLIRLAVYDRQSGAIRTVSGSFDNWVDDIDWVSDSRHVAFTAEMKGHVPLLVLDLQGGEPKLVADVGTIDAFDMAPGGAWAAVARRSIGSPWEIHRVAVLGAAENRPLTVENESIQKETDIRPAETLEVAGADGHPVQVFIVKPHGFRPGKKYPLILNVHGGPQSQWADAFRGDWQVYPGAGYVVAFPNPHGSTGFGQAYTAAISKDYTGRVMQDIESVAEALSKLPYVDSKRMGAMGWSWGGFAMMWLEGHTTRFRCLAAMMGVYDQTAFFGATEELWFPIWDLGGTPWSSELYAKFSPASYADRFKTPCLVITGEKDFRVPYTQSLEFFTALQVQNVPSRLIVFEKAGHWPAWYEMALYYNAHLEWFHKYLGGGPAPWNTVEMSRNGPPFKVE